MTRINWWIDGQENELARAVQAAGHNLIETMYACWEQPDYDSLIDNKIPTVCYGSIQFCQDFLRRSKKIYPAVIGNFDNYNCSVYYPHYKELVFNENYCMFPFGELKRKREFIFNNFAKDNMVFIRPDSGLKQFTGKLVDFSRFDKDIDLLNFYEPDTSLMCVVSTPKNIESEYRFLVVDKKIVTGSSYRVNGEHHETKCDLAHPFTVMARGLLDSMDWYPDDVFILDMAIQEDDHRYCNLVFSIMEIGAFSCAGLYAMDRLKVVQSVSSYVLRKWNEDEN